MSKTTQDELPHVKSSIAWQSWTPYAALVWSLVYAVLGLYWATGGRGFPYPPELGSDMLAPLAGRYGPVLAWSMVFAEGVPAVVVGLLMLRSVRHLRRVIIAAGVLLAGVLLLMMTGLNLLVKVGYIPGAIAGLLNADMSRAYLAAWTQWATIHQLLCLIAGFLWLAATLSYARWSAGACLYCGRSDVAEGWSNPSNAGRWGRIAVYVAMVAPVFYAITRFAWAIGIPLGLSEEAFHRGQASGTWIGGLSIAAFGLAGGLLMLGLVQRWGEVFPRWMIGLAKRRVPSALAIVPASLAAVILTVGGIGIWSGIPLMGANIPTGGVLGVGITSEVIFQLGPTLLFPLWGVALGVATLGYYYRRRGVCANCGRGVP